jgi:hypothetical protein
MSCDANLEMKLKLYEGFLEQGYSETEACEMAEKAFEEMD